jgi:hypothetical protein
MKKYEVGDEIYCNDKFYVIAEVVIVDAEPSMLIITELLGNKRMLASPNLTWLGKWWGYPEK